MAYDDRNLVTLGGLQLLADRTNAEVNSLKTANLANIKNIKYVNTENNTIKFFRNSSGTGVPDFIIDLPDKLFLEALHTKFESNFVYSSETYPNTTVLILQHQILVWMVSLY